MSSRLYSRFKPDGAAPARAARGSAVGEVGPVLLISPWYRPSVGGVVEVVDHQLRTLTEAGVETHLLVVCEQDSQWRINSDPTRSNLWSVRVPASAFYNLHLKSIAETLVRGPLTSWRLFRFVRRQRIRTIILHYPFAFAWPFLLLRYTMAVHLIASLHGTDVTKYADNSALSRWLIRRLLRASDAIIVIAPYLGEMAQGILHGKTPPIRMIPNCVDVNYFFPPPPSFNRLDTRPTLVHVSNFAPKKRTLDIVEAFAKVDVPAGIRLIMVGDGPDLEATKDRARSLGVAHRVEFVGAQKDVRPYLWQADLFVLASDEDGGPLALLEAMACGLPWVSTACGVSARLPLGECGVVVPSRSPDHLASAITKLSCDPQRRHAMGLRGRQRAQSDFGMKDYLDAHLKLIKEVEGRRALATRLGAPIRDGPP